MAKKGPSTLQDRLHRIEGQIRGIEKQLEEGKKTADVLMQIEAVISSLDSLKLEMIKKEMKEALLKELDNVVSMLK
jgi:DNA-binding FrmR family transcriptional regulator